jgi:hypothetical protein
VTTGVHVTDLGRLEEEYPEAKACIGADGRKSTVRRLRCGDALCVDGTVMKIVFCKYEVKGETCSLGWLKYFSLSQTNTVVKHTINELVGRPKEDRNTDEQVTSVTLQIFVSNDEFQTLENEHYTFKAPGSVDSVAAVLPKLGRSIQTWLEARCDEYGEEVLGPQQLHLFPWMRTLAARCAFSDRHVHPRMPIGSRACSLEAIRRVTNAIPLGWPLLTGFAL